jgi:hypothetical protein
MKKHFTLLILALMLALASSAKAEANEFLIKARLWYLTNIKPAEHRLSASLPEYYSFSRGLKNDARSWCTGNPDDGRHQNLVIPYWFTSLSEETIESNTQSILISDNFNQYFYDNYDSRGFHKPGAFDGLARTGVNLAGSMINGIR